MVFDKTGTLTTNQKNMVSYEGIELNPKEEKLLTGTLQASNHPLSIALYKLLHKNNIQILKDFKEETGKGMVASHNQNYIRVGSYNFVNETDNSVISAAQTENKFHNKTSVHISINQN